MEWKRLGLVVMLGTAMNAYVGTEFNPNTVTDVSQPKIVAKGVLLRPYIHPEAPINWESYRGGYSNSGWINSKTDWKYSYRIDIRGTSTAIYNKTLNKSLGIYAGRFAAFFGDTVYVIKNSSGILDDEDDDAVFKVRKSSADTTYYAHPEILEFNLKSNKYRMISFYGWSLYGEKGVECGLSDNQSWVIAKNIKKFESIDFGPVLFDGKDCGMVFRYFTKSRLGVYR